MDLKSHNTSRFQVDGPGGQFAKMFTVQRQKHETQLEAQVPFNDQLCLPHTDSNIGEVTSFLFILRSGTTS